MNGSERTNVAVLGGGVGGMTAAFELTVLGDLQLAAGLLADLFEGRVGQVFLKQFRDATDGKRACYQAVVETPVHVRRVETTLADRDWSIRVHPLDSHPIDHELGVGDQQATLAFDIEIDFVVENGFEIGRFAAPGGPRPALPPPVLDGHGSAIESAARWIWREITTVERASRDWLRRFEA